MKTRSYWHVAVVSLSLASASFAQPMLVVDQPLSAQERRDLVRLLETFDPKRPSIDDIPAIQHRWLLNQLKDLELLSAAPPEAETLTVCETVGDPHLEIGDKVRLSRLGSSGNVRIEIVRNEGAPNQTNPWTNPGGGNAIVLNPAITSKPAQGSPTAKKFTPEAVGRARVNPHTGGTPTDHDFFVRRSARPPTALCTDPDPLYLTVPEQHPTGDRHGGHAVLN